MAELVVAGPKPMQRWRRSIPDGEVVRLGRAPRNGWAVPWDGLISREHAELVFEGSQLNVRRLDAARNPIYFNDVDTAEFKVAVGEQFRIGKTFFQLTAIEVNEDAPSPLEERSYHPDELKKFEFHNADHRLEVLSKLPRIIAQSANDEEIAGRLVELLLEAIPHADAAAVVQYDEDPRTATKPSMMRWDARSDEMGRFSPSRRLILTALQRGEGVLYIWQESDDATPAYTVSGNLDWAFCMPFKDEASKNWSIYVSGSFGGNSTVGSVNEEDLKGDLRFAELLTDFIGAIRQVRLLEQRHAGLSQFFSPAVLETLRGAESATVLEPKESDITVLFCDVRGFSRKSEKAQHQLKELLDRVSDALGVMTCGIIKYDGVIADFQGDAALGFWGWPTASEHDRLLACRAALEILAEFKKADQEPDNTLSEFQVGIGIAHGRAIAGKIGTQEQIKVGAFGPVVNLGARLESMTKELRASILIDEETAEYVRNHMPASEGRCRRLGRIRPAGMHTDLMVSELLPAADKDARISDQNVKDYESAVDAVMDGRWTEALELLDRLPVEDRTKDFLMIFIAMNQYEPPPDWDGVIRMLKK